MTSEQTIESDGTANISIASRDMPAFIRAMAAYFQKDWERAFRRPEFILEVLNVAAERIEELQRGLGIHGHHCQCLECRKRPS